MIRISFAVVPLLIALLGACIPSVPVMLLVFPVLFAMVRFLPFCRRRENLWMFVYAAVAVVPVNVYVICRAGLYELFDESRFKCGLWSVLLFILLLGIEEIILGVITRLLWKRQYRLPVFNEE